MATLIFIHGLESSNQGTKSVYFRKRFPEMITPHFTGDLESRMADLREILSGKSEIRMVGSSFGGLMATLYAMEYPSHVKRLILLAPALNMIPFTRHEGQTVAMPVWIYHGRNDDVIPLEDVEPVARKAFTHLSFNPVEDDHFLHQTFKTIDWDTLLSSS
jgi:pimeloyl-ACP methyl ester carboxylesterase